MGLTDKTYFWEIAIGNIRKIGFIMCASLISSNNPSLKALIGIMVLIV